jgi:hypothetical protein
MGSEGGANCARNAQRAFFATFKMGLDQRFRNGHVNFTA